VHKLEFYRIPVLAHMRMITKFSLTSYEPAGIKLSTSNYLFKEMRNEAKAAIRVVEAIRRKLVLTWDQIDVELTLRKDGNWDHPGEVLDLSFLKKFIRHV
jgi:hypothetical protein